MKRLRAVALGYQGFGNVGDEAILSGIERLIADAPLQVTAVLAGDRAPVPAFAAADRVTSRRLLPNAAAVAAIRRAQVLLIAGGGLIHDHWPIVIPRYLAWSVLARALGLGVAWVGVGVGPIRQRWARALAAATIRLANLVTVRDETSLLWVRRVAPGVSATVVPDPAFFLEPPAPSARGEGTALLVRRPVPSEAWLAPRLAEALAEVAHARIAAGTSVTILTMEPYHDDPYASRIAARAAQPDRAGPTVRPLPLDAAAALEMLSKFDDAISVRLHGLILCALAGTPCLPIVYDQKVLGTAARLGLADVAVPVQSVVGGHIVERLAKVRSEVVQGAVRAGVDELRAEGPSFASLLASLADG